eukprot:925482-Prorocentrum_minimum.AAC.2
MRRRAGLRGGLRLRPLRRGGQSGRQQPPLQRVPHTGKSEQSRQGPQQVDRQQPAGGGRGAPQPPRAPGGGIRLPPREPPRAPAEGVGAAHVRPAGGRPPGARQPEQ